MQDKFSFDSAFMHFQRTKGPSGFMWKYILVYTIILSILMAVCYGPFFMTFMSIFSSISIDESNVDQAALEAKFLTLAFSMAFAIPVFMIAYLVVTSMFEAAALRRYLFGDGFRLKLGKDEFRIMGILLIWFGVFFVAYLLIFGAMGAVMAPAIMSNSPEFPRFLGLLPLVFIAVLGPTLFFCVRLSPASAMTMRDDKLTFFSAWRTTKGRFWPMVGAFLVIYLIVYAIQMVGQFVALIPMVGGFVSFAASVDPNDPEAIMGVFTSPFMIFAFALLMMVQVVSMAFMHFGFLGVTSRAVMTDPQWVNPETAATFD